MSSCEFEKLVHLYVDGELQPGDAGALEEHLKSCADCRSLIIDIGKTKSFFAKKTIVPPRDGFLEETIRGLKRSRG